MSLVDAYYKVAFAKDPELKSIQISVWLVVDI